MAMKYVAAYLMCALSGTESPSAKDVEKTLKSVGASVESDVLNKLIESVQSGKPIHEVIAAGMEKLQKIPSGGAAPAAASGGAAAGGAPAGGAPEKKKEEEPEEEEDDLGFSLFD